MIAAEIMQRAAPTVRCDAPWREALHLLLGDGLNAVSVVDDTGCIAGIISQTDLASRTEGAERIELRAVLDGVLTVRPARTLLRWHTAPNWGGGPTVAALMTHPAVTVRGEATIAAVARLLLRHDIAQVPVVDAARRPLGLVRQRDLIATLADRGDALPSAVSLSIPATRTPPYGR